jgi:hypothetical protein
MVRKSLIVASLALLAMGGGRAAQADPVFLEPYGELFSARTFSPSAGDPRPKDAFQGQGAGEEGKASSFVISPTFWMTDIPLGGGLSTDVMIWGVTLGYAASMGDHPWSITGTILDFDVDPPGPGDANNIGFDVAGKFTVWQPAANLPVVSLVGRYMGVINQFHRWDVGVAADQKITNNVYGTVNLLYSRFNFNGGGSFDDFKPGLGLTWSVSPKLSLSGNYIFNNDADSLQSISATGIDTWSIAATYLFNDQASVRFGGGKHETFFANLNWRWK